MSGIYLSNFVLWCIVILQIIFLCSLTKLVAEFIKKFRISNGKPEFVELKIGEKVPLFREKDQLKREVVLSKDSEEYKLLIFAQKDCIYCKEIISNLKEFKEKFPLELIVISEEKLSDELYDQNIHFLVSKMLFKDYKIRTTPTIMLLDPKNYLLSSPKYTHSHGLKIYLGNFFKAYNDYTAG
jgi:thioredoxin-related protein